MSTYSLTVGLIVRHGDRTWRLERQLQDGLLVFIDQITGTPHTLTPSALQRSILAKKYVVVHGDQISASSAPNSAVPLIKTLDDFAPHDAKEVQRRYRYVIHMKRMGLSRGMYGRIQDAVSDLKGLIPKGSADAEQMLDPRVPSAWTVMQWMKRWEESGGNIVSLLRRHSMRVTPKRLDSNVLRIARDKVRTFYCTQARPTAAATHVQIDAALAREAAKNGTPVMSISASTLRRLIDEVPPYERDVSRFGRAYARNEWRYSLKGIDARRPMQRYEIDHTVLDIVVISDISGMPLGRPTITVLIDAFSGYVAGFFISFWGTGLASSLAALKVAISPKDEYCQGQNLEQKWLPYGIPSLMVVDNGLEFHSPQFLAIAQHLNTDLRFCAVRQPWLKPFVERALGALCAYLPSQGRVEKRLDNYLPANPDKSAAITFSALCSGLQKAFVDIHPFEPNERKLWLPFDRFSEGMEKQLPPNLPTSTSELDIIVAVSKSLTVGNEGVVMNYLRFNSIELQQIRRHVGLTFKANIKFNPEDLNMIHVQDPRSNGWLPVPSCQPEYTADLSLVQHKAIRAQLKGDLTRRQIPEYLMRTKAELADTWNSQAVIGKRLKGNQLRAMAGLTSSHVLLPNRQCDTAPLERRPAESVPLLTDDELVPLSTSIPDFEAFAML
ncbi:transposase family protein [Pelomonas sp. APW6]|uniref:Transposase family protein n=1 Tax=Roseateles subflavus TaxID=3053353 RepID=A0ABT7LNX8_9BURK|nr:transposase family protein [Pelomonas sp. APW6]MDL5034581.1 transposase family protein [Pelomonas sp. APW6]